jgi:hypothetical protein
MNLITGCGKNPIVAATSKLGLAIAQFTRENVRPYLASFREADLQATVDDFPEVKKAWEEIKFKHQVPVEKQNRVDDIFYFQELLLQYFPVNHPEIDTYKSEPWLSKSTELVSHISLDYYDALKDVEIETSSGVFLLNSDPELMRILNELRSGNPPEIPDPANIAPLMVANFAELVEGLASIRFSPDSPLTGQTVLTQPLR